MSRDSSRSHIHLHASRHADLFEEFTQPLTISSTNQTASHLPTHTTLLTSAPPYTSNSSSTYPSAFTLAPTLGSHNHASTNLPLSLTTPLAPGHSTQIPPEDINVPAHHMPPNPEDEDDVVPDQHAAFGITAAMRGREGREREWRDFGSLGEAVRGTGLIHVDGHGTGNGNGTGRLGLSGGSRIR